MLSASDLRERLIGAWSLVDIDFRIENATNDLVSYSDDTGTRGILLYTPDGYMSVQISQSSAPRSAIAVPGSVSEEAEVRTFIRGFIAYSGRFDIKEHKGRLHLMHFVELCNFPNGQGDVQERTADLEGDFLQLSTDTAISGMAEFQSATLRWKRIDIGV
ncbi:Lipocalin-like domain-containing protein [Talaromyces proteolyticus]|uniref:Lipocalin-like domain-containing protein n=1 Tax=Talaromyces proteolyticus TaxID=1131652 RepID=A0AAD4KHK0_9EURO|nr:Lipocalin-like domain-containing protein [Talaromyces proteolyticus]KAH8688608.1 Lipocalin-like domain-containing protein [Talaromyces proteolyticus]